VWRITVIACLAACGRIGFDTGDGHESASFVQTNNAYCARLVQSPGHASIADRV